MKNNRIHAAKYALDNFRCGECGTGIVQVFRQWKRGGTITTTVSGCLDCGNEYGIMQASKLDVFPKNAEVCWP